jgi:hypothetical protein
MWPQELSLPLKSSDLDICVYKLPDGGCIQFAQTLMLSLYTSICSKSSSGSGNQYLFFELWGREMRASCR